MSFFEKIILVIVSPPRVFFGLERSSGFRIFLLAAPSQGFLTPVACRLRIFSLAQAAFVPGHGCGAAGDFHPSSTTPAQFN